MFVFLQTVGQVESPLVQVGGMEAGLATVVTGLAVDVGTAVPVATLPHLEEGAEEGLGLRDGQLGVRNHYHHNHHNNHYTGLPA